jgi:methyl-accepting chemotaxis protein
MTHAPPPAPTPQPRPRIGLGLKLRLWLACLSGGLVAAAGTLWMLATPSLSPTDPAVYGWLAGVACTCLVIGLLLALWIDHHVVGHLHGLLLGLRSNRVADLRGLPAGSGWGELSELGDAVQDTLEKRQREARALHDLDRVRQQLEILFAGIEHWQRTERWERPALPEGEVSAVGELLAHALQRRASVDEQNREAARQVANELAAVIAEAREAAAQAERGFIEATALQTTVRELHRLAGELAASLRRPSGPAPALAELAPAPAPAAPAAESDAPPSHMRRVLEELVGASFASVESLGRGLMRVQDVSDQVQRLANRATLIAIQTLAGTSDPATFGDELKTLAREVRDATDRTQRFAHEIEVAVAEAEARMREARERAIARFEAAGSEPVRAVEQRPAPPASSPPAGAPQAAPAIAADVRRLLERVLEMVQDASAKGERVSTASERASSVAERLARRLDGNASDAEALVVRLAPVGDFAPAPEPVTPELRLVDDEEAEPADSNEKPQARVDERSGSHDLDERSGSHDLDERSESHDKDAGQRP